LHCRTFLSKPAWRFTPLYGRTKKASDAAAITPVAPHPHNAMERDTVKRPTTLGLCTSNIITAIRGAANKPFITAAQYSDRTAPSPGLPTKEWGANPCPLLRYDRPICGRRTLFNYTRSPCLAEGVVCRQSGKARFLREDDYSLQRWLRFWSKC